MPRKSRLKLPPLGLPEPFGSRLARLRKERGFTQIELASRIGLTQTLVSDYERGKLRLNAEMVVRFARALGVSSDALLGLKTDPAPGLPRSRRLLRRLQRVEALPEAAQRDLLHYADLLLKARRGRNGNSRSAYGS
jgi:transcriptional regulator with XRE-family HTH domain